MSKINNRSSGAAPPVSLSSRAVCGDGRFVAVGFDVEVLAHDRFATGAGKARMLLGEFWDALSTRRLPTRLWPSDELSHMTFDTRYLDEFYDPGRRVAVFSGIEKLVDLCRRARADRIWRDAMVDADQQRTLAQHTFVHRARELAALWD